MGNGFTKHEAPTRRDYVKYSGALVGGSLLAGCSGDGSPSTPTDTATSTETTTSTTTTNESYTVSIEPAGEVSFDTIPETWIANNGSWADMGIALGQEPPLGLWRPNRYHTHIYDEIPGVSVDKSQIVELFGTALDKEQFYSLDADVHVIDPNFVLARSKWEQADLDEVSENIGPIFGNSIFTHAYPWHEDYRYYTLYEAFEKLSRVFQAQDRYEAFATLHDEVRGEIQQRLPPESERPSVAILLVTSDQPEEFYPYPVNEGTAYKQWRDLGASSALKDSGIADYFAAGNTIDYEALTEADPDILLMWDGTGRFERMTRDEFQSNVLAFMQEHDVASQLTAVENGDVYRGAGLYQGPIINLVWTERGAWQLYPDEFDWGEQLFDRQRVADIINGNL
mgnify:CR=1 FL=1